MGLKEEFSKTDQWKEKRVEIAKRAYDGGWVIYSPTTQQWYTPREYVDSGEEVVMKKEVYGGGMKPDIDLCEPGHALIAQGEKVAREQAKLNSMINVIRKSFKFEPNKKK